MFDVSGFVNIWTEFLVAHVGVLHDYTLDYAETDTVEYHRDKLVAAVKIPKLYMGYGGDSTRASLSSEDIRFARTVMREGEIAVRTSLGASRRRIVLQLFAEALVLVTGATVIGLTLAQFALGRIGRLFFVIQQAPQPPFWWNDALSPTTVAYAIVLAVVGAAVLAYDFALGYPTLGSRIAVVAGAALAYAATVGIAVTLATRRASRVALPLLRAACATLAEMATFAEAAVPDRSAE